MCYDIFTARFQPWLAIASEKWRGGANFGTTESCNSCHLFLWTMGCCGFVYGGCPWMAPRWKKIMNDQPGDGMGFLILYFLQGVGRLHGRCDAWLQDSWSQTWQTPAISCHRWVLRTGQTYHYTIYPQVRASVEYPKIPQVTARPCDDLVGRVSNEKWLFSDGSFPEGVSFIAECLNPMKSH